MTALPASLLISKNSARRGRKRNTKEIAAIAAGISQVISAGIRGIFTLFMIGVRATKFVPIAESRILIVIRAIFFLGGGLAARALAIWSFVEASSGNRELLMTNVILSAFGMIALVSDVFVVLPRKIAEPKIGIAIGAFVGLVGLFLTCVYMIAGILTDWFTFGVYLAGFLGLTVRGLRLFSDLSVAYKDLIDIGVTVVVTGLQMAAGYIKLASLLARESPQAAWSGPDSRRGLKAPA
jgi:hypothetical protein